MQFILIKICDNTHFMSQAQPSKLALAGIRLVLLSKSLLPVLAQAQGQVEAELALFSFDAKPQQPAPPPPPIKVYLAAYMHPVATQLQS